MKTDNTAERLIHYSAEPLVEVRSTPLDEQKRHHKPCGLWVSVEGPDDWKSWCEGEEWRLGSLVNAHQIILTETSNILRISTPAGVDELTAQYSKSKGNGLSRYSIQWSHVAKGYDGIIIAPYIWEMRLKDGANWYYSWDCASGCIWNASAIQQVIPLASALIAKAEGSV